MVEVHLGPAIVILVLGATISLALLVFPHRIVQLQGRFYRTAYKTVLRTSDEDIDRHVRLPWDAMFSGDRSQFAREAEVNPQKYDRLILMYRIIGGLIAVGVVLGLSGVALGIYVQAIQNQVLSK